MRIKLPTDKTASTVIALNVQLYHIIDRAINIPFVECTTNVPYCLNRTGRYTRNKLLSKTQPTIVRTEVSRFEGFLYRCTVPGQSTSTYGTVPTTRDLIHTLLRFQYYSISRPISSIRCWFSVIKRQQMFALSEHGFYLYTYLKICLSRIITIRSSKIHRCRYN